MLISAKGKKGNDMKDLRRFDRDPNVVDLTDELGEADFVVDACLECQAITITVKTDNQKLDESQNAVANYIVKPFDSENGPLIMVSQDTPGKVGKTIQCRSFRSKNDVAAKISYAVVSRGRILFHNTTESFDGMFKSWSFKASKEMSPSARLIGYYIDSNERVVADSILLKIEDKLPTEVVFRDGDIKVAVGPDGRKYPLNEIEKIPGAHYDVKIQAPQGTRLGLLSVDQSVYLLRNENRLTKERIFKSTEELDLGCGEGGGKDNKDIFKNAGVVLMTDNFVSDGREDYGCSENDARKKRSADDDSGYKSVCCELGRKNDGNVSCAILAIDGNKGLDKECRKAFWTCCTAKYGTTDTALLGRNGDFFGDFGPSDEEILEQTQVRSFFPETWIYDEKVVARAELF
ncbi:hypothetical protein OS493_014902 [Desmophyllum pertusum]|uniref:Alpha-2-macroglobulin bait region domain-containing protein n=1 Tax=Desmophyllum pertusum TaxID=174260 RepID=A0A9X0CFJ6_9CNID|nr:hypothetical protein OS493_014902 [Desmophyllum pertusum]